MQASQKHKQSKYFESLKLRSSQSELTPIGQPLNVSPATTTSPFLSPAQSHSSSMATTAATAAAAETATESNIDPKTSFVSPLESPFKFKPTESHTMFSTLGPSSPLHCTAAVDRIEASPLRLHLQTDATTGLLSNGPLSSSSSSTLQNRFVSTSSAPKALTPSPPKRFSKHRLNNTENIDYTLNSKLSPAVISQSASPSPSKTVVDRTSPTSLNRIRTNNSNYNNNYSSYDDTDPLEIEYFDDLSLLDNSEAQVSFFKEPMLSPVQVDNRTLFESPTTSISRRRSQQLFSPTKDSSGTSVNLNALPLAMKIICNSRAEHNIHAMNGFVNLSYIEFWNLTPEEGQTYKEWNKLQFETQSLIFEIFTNLKKIRFNLHRLIFIYGLEFKDTGFISDNIYDKTFEVLQEFYYYLDKLVVKKLKPLFDDHFFVDDSQVLKILTGWFKQLKLQYRHISGSVVYLSKLSSNEDVRKLILGISKKDFENSSNRSAVAPIELFNSYFVKMFTSIELLFERLKSVYKDSNNTKNYDATENIEQVIKEINNISDSTSELEKKISFNEKLSYKTEIDFSHMEMVDMFNPNRKSKEPLRLEMKTNLNWSNAILAPFDNYLIILQVKSNAINLNKKDEYVLFKFPISIQYLEIDSYVDGNYKMVIIKDIGNKAVYHFRRANDVTVAILDRFLRDLQNLKTEFWLSDQLNKKIELKIFNANSFISKTESDSPFDLAPIPNKFNLINLEVAKGGKDDELDLDEFEPILTNVLSCDYFSYKYEGTVEKLCLIGTTFGIFIGKLNDSASFHKVHQIANVKKIIVLNNEVVFCIGGESLYRLSIEKLFKTYKFKLPASDINVFQENKRYINDFTVGYHSSATNNGCPYLFAWNNKMVYYTKILKESDWKFFWQSFKTHYNIVRLETVYANNFAVGHIVDGSAVWNLSKLSDIRSISLNQLDVKDILKNETPVAIFPFPNQEKNISEVLVVFSKFCTRMKNVKGKYVQSSDEIIWFGMQCENASFDCEEKILITVGKQAVEVRALYDDITRKSDLIGCLVGSSFSLINEMPGKAILKVQDINGHEEYKKQIIFKIRRMKNPGNK